MAGGRWQLAGGKWQAVRSRPHNYRFDLWQHFCSQLHRTQHPKKHWKNTGKIHTKNPKRKSHGMCPPAPAPAPTPAYALQQACVPAKLPSSSSSKVAPNCSEAWHLQLSTRVQPSVSVSSAFLELYNNNILHIVITLTAFKRSSSLDYT